MRTIIVQEPILGVNQGQDIKHQDISKIQAWLELDGFIQRPHLRMLASTESVTIESMEWILTD